MNTTFRRRIMPPTNPNHARGVTFSKATVRTTKASQAVLCFLPRGRAQSDEESVRQGSWTDRSNGPKTFCESWRIAQHEAVKRMTGAFLYCKRLGLFSSFVLYCYASVCFVAGLLLTSKQMHTMGVGSEKYPSHN